MTLYLLVLNLLVLGVGIGLQQYVAARKPALTEFNAGKIRFWSQPDVYQPAARPVEAVAKPEAPARLCLEIADLNQARYLELRTILKGAGLDTGQCTYSFDKKLGWWVYWPPEYEAVLRDKAVKAIQAAGVKDYLPITQGAMAQSFSLGVFSSETQANQYRDALRGKGLAKVEYGPRPSMGSGRLGCLPGDAASLEAFRSRLPAWAQATDEQRCRMAELARP